MTVATDIAMVDAALEYATRGWPVFPCCPARKRPLVEGESERGAKDGGLYLATTDEARIRTWWRKWPNAMIGVPTGSKTGNLLDLDLGDPQVIAGAEYLDRLREHVGGIPDTAIAETGTGGFHIWFKSDPDKPIANGVDVVPGLHISQPEGAIGADGKKAKPAQIDIRGEGGYAIVPPSIRSNGGAYVWCPEPWDGLAEPTERLLAILNKDELKAAKTSERARAAAEAKAKAGPWGDRKPKREARTPGSDFAQPQDASSEAIRRYAESALDREIGTVAAAGAGGRNHALNTAAFKLAQLVAAGALSEAEVRSALEAAASQCGLDADDGQKSIQDTINSGFTSGISKPRDLSHIGARARRAEERRTRWEGSDTGASSDPGDGGEQHESDAALHVIELKYPIPMLAAPRICYEFSRGRIMLHKEVERKGDQPPMLIPVATPFGATARLRYADREDAYGLRVAIQDMAGKPRYIDVDRADLARQGGAPIRERLYAEGLKTDDDGEHIAVKCLKAASPPIEITVVSRPGWHEDQDFPTPVFICPDGKVAGTDREQALELSVNTRLQPRVARAGTLEGWQKAVTVAVDVEGCEHWILGACAAFVGPILSLTGMDTCGINLSGLSSSGKSTAQRLAVSAWSTPDIRKAGLAYSAKSTVNAMEGLAARANGTVFSLDELAHVSGPEIAKLIYTLAGGTGKQRMNAEAVMRASYTWSTFALLSSECSLEEKVKGDKGDWVAGMAARFADVDVTSVNRAVPREVLDVIAAVDRNFGHAGPAFLSALIAEGVHKDPVGLRDKILAQAKRIAGDTSDSTQVRAATPFALLQAAGTMAVRFKILPEVTSVAGMVGWAWQRFMRSSDARALDPQEQVINNLQSYILSRWAVTIRHIASGGGAQKAEGWFDSGVVYLPRETFRAAAGNVMTEEATAGVLLDRGYIAKSEADRPYTRYVRGIGKLQAYALKRSVFGREDDPPNGYSTGRGSES